MKFEHNESFVVSNLLEEDPESIEMVLTFVDTLEDRILKLIECLKSEDFIALQAYSHK